MLVQFFVTLCCVFFQSHDPSMFGSRNKHAARSFSTPRVFTNFEEREERAREKKKRVVKEKRERKSEEQRKRSR